MSVTSTATATWSGTLVAGSGSTNLATSGAGTFNVNWKARSEGQVATTTPEELLGAAHAACYAMAMSHELAGKGLEADRIDVSAAVTFVPGEGITRIGLRVAATIPGISDEDFRALTAAVKDGCPVSQALAGTTIEMDEVSLRS